MQRHKILKETGAKFVLVTLQGGGDYKILREDDGYINFDKIKKQGYVQLKYGDYVPEKTPVRYVALLELKDDWDFVLAEREGEKNAI